MIQQVIAPSILYRHRGLQHE